MTIVRHVFNRMGKPIRDCRHAWNAACAAVGLATVTKDSEGHVIHIRPWRVPDDFRRSAVRRMERAGVSRSVAMRVTGHKTEAIYKRYAIVNERDMAEGLAKLNDLPTTPSKVASIAGRK